MESRRVAGEYVSLVATGGESKCVCSPGFLSLGHRSIRPNWVKRGRWMEGGRDGGRTRMRQGPRACWKIGSAKIRKNRTRERKKEHIYWKGRKWNGLQRKKKATIWYHNLFLISFPLILSLSLARPLYLPPSLSPSWWLYQSASSCCTQIKMDASPWATVETHLQLPACAIHRRPAESSHLSLSSFPLFKFPCCLFIFPQPLLCVAFPPSRSNFIKKSYTTAHTHTRVRAQTHTAEGYYLPFWQWVTNWDVWGVRMRSCSLCIAAIQQNKGQIAFSPCFLTSNGVRDRGCNQDSTHSLHTPDW